MINDVGISEISCKLPKHAMSFQHFCLAWKQLRNFLVGYWRVRDDFVDSLLFFLQVNFNVSNSCLGGNILNFIALRQKTRSSAAKQRIKSCRKNQLQ